MKDLVFIFNSRGKHFTMNSIYTLDFGVQNHESDEKKMFYWNHKSKIITHFHITFTLYMNYGWIVLSMLIIRLMNNAKIGNCHTVFFIVYCHIKIFERINLWFTAIGSMNKFAFYYESIKTLHWNESEVAVPYILNVCLFFSQLTCFCNWK